MVSHASSSLSSSSSTSKSSSSSRSLYEISSDEEGNGSASVSSGEDENPVESSEEEPDPESRDGDAGLSPIDEDGRCRRVVRLLQERKDLSLLTLEDCKAYLRKHRLRLTGTKGICTNRICEHWRLKDGDGLKLYPKSSFIIDCTGDVCNGDIVLFTQWIYDKFDVVTRGGGHAIGKRTVAGRIVKESYGALKQQHTFTVEILWSTGVKTLPPLFPLLVKGRNLYRLKTFRQPWPDESKRRAILAEKHKRGAAARHLRAISKAHRSNGGSKHKGHSATKRPLQKRQNGGDSGSCVIYEKPETGKAKVLASAHCALNNKKRKLTTNQPLPMRESTGAPSFQEKYKYDDGGRRTLGIDHTKRDYANDNVPKAEAGSSQCYLAFSGGLEQGISSDHHAMTDFSNYYQRKCQWHVPYRHETEFHYPNFEAGSSSASPGRYGSQPPQYQPFVQMPSINKVSCTVGHTVFPYATQGVQWDPTRRDMQLDFQRIYQEVPARSLIQMPSNNKVLSNLGHAVSPYASQRVQWDPTGRNLQLELQRIYQDVPARSLGAGSEGKPIQCSTPGCQDLGSYSCVVLACHRCCRAIGRKCRRHQ